jgi:aspartyl aminopeptidase
VSDQSPQPASDQWAEARGLLEFVDAAPSPFHAVAEATTRLVAAGFSVLAERDPWPDAPGRYLVVRGGSLVAWSTEGDRRPEHGFRVLGAHTDSPNLRVKPRPDTGAAGLRQLGVEVYGGALLNSWLDRDLGLSGRVAVRVGDTVELRLFRIDRPLLRIPQLAIHLDRGVNENGLKLNPQQHLAPLWATGPVDHGGFGRFLADELAVGPDDIVAWDAMAHDVMPAALLGVDDEFVSAPRIDNLASCFTALRALEHSLDHDHRAIPVVCLFDHEEVGSQSAQGADSTMLPTVLERVAATCGAGRDGFHRALAASFCVSADGAHATNPNYAERHEPAHQIALNGGPVLKLNSNVRYATNAGTGAIVTLAAERAQVPLQHFVVRTDMPCGSTIGPITAARLGIPTVDVGIPQLAMHSARELCGAHDPGRFVDLLVAVLGLDLP